jgi:tRNA threonylcarbamoyladenosine biosynthesis protein TsaE
MKENSPPPQPHSEKAENAFPVCASDSETEEAGYRFGKTLTPGSVVALDGPLGAGKTVFARGIARAAGVLDAVTSPTYTIINEYETADGVPFFHVDAYRLSGADDFEAAGGGEIFDGKSICVIEWGERIKTALPPETISITIKIPDGGRRSIYRRPPRSSHHCE